MFLIYFHNKRSLSLSFQYGFFFGVHSLHFKIYCQKKGRWPSKIQSSHFLHSQSHWLESSHAVTRHLHSGVSVCMCSESHEKRCCVRALTRRPLQRRVLVVVHLRTAVLAWLLAVVYSIPNHDSEIRSFRACTNNSFSTLLIFPITHFFATRNFSWTRFRYCNSRCHSQMLQSHKPSKFGTLVRMQWGRLDLLQMEWTPMGAKQGSPQLSFLLHLFPVIPPAANSNRIALPGLPGLSAWLV